MKRLSVVLAALLFLCSCSPTPQSEVPSAQETTSLASSVSPSSQTPETPQPQAEEEPVMIGFGGQEYLIHFGFPEGIFYDGSNIEQADYGIFPETIYLPDEMTGSTKVGAVYTTEIKPEQFSGSDILLLPEYDEMLEYHYSSDHSLTPRSFFWLGDILVSTGFGAYDLYATHYHIPLDPEKYLVVWFFHNETAEGAEEYFESLIQNITIEPST